MSLKEKTIVLGVTGSIAAYKAADLVSLLVKEKADVHVVLTKEAQQFITPMTLQTLSRNRVATDFWQPDQEHECGHIQLADAADLLLVAPLTAHTMGCFAHGLAPDMLTAIYLATPAPVLLAPAMNGKMYAHPATQQNKETLQHYGCQFVEPADGMLACGYEGVGKLAQPEVIVDAARECLA